ncbi:coenzyme F420-0:L-glutamate ligase [Methanobrevibacter filiformis]|uniref:Coenzyme F420:L-glutamate ligase n=1 Tax=Methanobrevibacter filiformis TaxID=55758 RepID=A0A166EUX0_9EURY|nr:coenzyme F420-0:L-glutamate ligase [Methanobrevibacter filiformis]KZX17039.1 coenzyme F420:L-glutamate ligase [Methanobrevibacter filiformis]
MTIELIGLNKIPIIDGKESIAKIIIEAIKSQKIEVKDQDIILIAETLIAKCEENIVDLNKVIPSDEAIKISKKTKKDPKIVEVIIQESNEIIAVGPDFIISETKEGFVCANAGIDESNVKEGFATPIPENPDESARTIKEELEEITGKKIAIIITDTQGRAFRNGAVGVSIGCAGINPLWQRKGEKDLYGRELQTTEIAIGDELASAASLLMGQANEGIPVVIIRGISYFKDIENDNAHIKTLLRSKERDIFRNIKNSYE